MRERFRRIDYADSVGLAGIGSASKARPNHFLNDNDFTKSCHKARYVGRKSVHMLHLLTRNRSPTDTTTGPDKGAVSSYRGRRPVVARFL